MSQLEVRPAQAEDREAVLAFCAHTWEWGDYIEREWEKWLHDFQGILFVCTMHGQPVGVAHLHMLTAIDAWFEGLRVDPAYRQQGLASALTEAAMVEAMRRGATHIRLVTHFENTAAIHVFKNAHMRQVGGFVPFTAIPLPQTPSRRYAGETIQLATLEDLDDIIDYLNASNIFPPVGGLYYTDFTAHVITAALLEQHIHAQHIYLLKRWNRLDGLAIAEPRQDFRGKYLSLGYIDGMTIEAISLIAHDLRRRLTQLELESIYVYAPDLVLIRDGLTGIEYTWSGDVFYTFERGLI